jgi:predicted permease
MLADLRLALRTLRARPGFTLAVVLCVALGVAVDTTVYSMVNSVVLRPLPYTEPARLVAVRQVDAAAGSTSDALALADFADLRDGNRTFASLSAFGIRLVNFALDAEPEGVYAAAVTPGYFETLGVRARLGRTFVRGDDPAAPVVVLGEQLWRERLDGDPLVVGRTVLVDGVARTVIGVMPANVALTNDVERLWIPVDADAPGVSRAATAYQVIGRLRPGATVAQADADVRALAARLAAEHPETNAGRGARALALRDALLPASIRSAFLVLLGAVTLVLVVACANVANLMLGYGVARSHEMAVRTALGASRGRVARQLLIESVLLALLGGAAGALLAVWGIQAAMHAIPYELPPWMRPTVDGRVLLYTFAVAALSGVAFGLVPALRAGRTDPQSVLRDGARGLAGARRQGRARDLLVAVQLALSLVLLVSAGLLMKSFVRLQRAEPGFATAGTLAVRLNAAGERHRDPARRAALFEAVRAWLVALPGVQLVAAAPYPPGWNNFQAASVEAEGRELPAAQRPRGELRPTIGDYFAALGAPLVAGRGFTSSEAADSSSRVAIVNAHLAAAFWPNTSALGRRVRIDGGEWLTVVGVAPDLYLRGVGMPVGHQLYVPYATQPGRTVTFLARATGGASPLALAGDVRRAVAAVDPTLAIVDVAPLSTILAQSLWQARFFGRLFAAFAVAALLLASVGLYGVVSYATRQRTREIGIRVALGARSADVYGAILGRSLRLVGASLGGGLVLAAGVTRLLASQLYGVSPADPGVFAGVTVALGGVALAASYLPARRAARVDPVIALRAD